jgi:cell wall-associated NlpC family hydrolase
MTDKDLFLKTAFSLLNVPYVWGGNDPLYGLDCSGYCCYVLKSVGLLSYNIDLSSTGLSLCFTHKVPITAPSPCLLFFGTFVNITHVAISLNSTSMIESGGGNRECISIAQAKKIGACVRIRPIRKDFLYAVKLFDKA